MWKFLRTLVLAFGMLAAFGLSSAEAQHRPHHRHHHWRHVVHRVDHRQYATINTNTGAITSRQPFDFLGSIFRPPTATAQYAVQRSVETIGTIPQRIGNVGAFIVAQAKARGMDARWALHIWATEGQKAYVGDLGTSFGPFQLHYAGRRHYCRPGLGEVFTARTGLDARNPGTWRAQVIFALDWAHIHGWAHDWYGWMHYHGASAWMATWHAHHHHVHHHWRGV